MSYLIDEIKAQDIVNSVVDVLVSGYNIARSQVMQLSPVGWLTSVSFDAYQSVYPGGSKADEEWDPFRHAYISAKFTQFLGEDTARLLGDINEAAGRNNPIERNRDYHSNDHGIEFGKLDSKTDDFSDVDASLASTIKTAITNGTLKTDPESVPTNYLHQEAEITEVGLEILNNIGSSIGQAFNGFIKDLYGIVENLEEYLDVNNDGHVDGLDIFDPLKGLCAPIPTPITS